MNSTWAEMHTIQRPNRLLVRLSITGRRANRAAWRSLKVKLLAGDLRTAQKMASGFPSVSLYIHTQLGVPRLKKTSPRDTWVKHAHLFLLCGRSKNRFACSGHRVEFTLCFKCLERGRWHETPKQRKTRWDRASARELVSQDLP